MSRSSLPRLVMVCSVLGIGLLGIIIYLQSREEAAPSKAQTMLLELDTQGRVDLFNYHIVDDRPGAIIIHRDRRLGAAIFCLVFFAVMSHMLWKTSAKASEAARARRIIGPLGWWLLIAMLTLLSGAGFLVYASTERVRLGLADREITRTTALGLEFWSHQYPLAPKAIEFNRILTDEQSLYEVRLRQAEDPPLQLVLVPSRRERTLALARWLAEALEVSLIEMPD